MSNTNKIRLVRVTKELEFLKKSPPWGVSCSPVESGILDRLEATIMGPKDSPYEHGVFSLRIDIPESYPFDPPQVRFITPIYHPNIDKAGRICMDLLKMPPNGMWKPSVQLSWLLVAIQTLLRNPNPEDPLVLDIANQYKQEPEAFREAAARMTRLSMPCESQKERH